MAGIILDTNTVLSYITGRNPGQQAVVDRVLKECTAAGTALLVTELVLHELVYVMSRVYGSPTRVIKAIIRALLTTDNLEVCPNPEVEKIMLYRDDKIRDFGDATLAAVAASRPGSRIFTFDGRFAGELTACGIGTYPV